MNADNYFTVSEEMFAAWLDGSLSTEEEDRFLAICAVDPKIQEIQEANDQVEETYEEMTTNGYQIPQEILDDFDIPSIENDSIIYDYDSVEPYDGDIALNEQSDIDESFIDCSDEECHSEDFQEDGLFM